MMKVFLLVVLMIGAGSCSIPKKVTVKPNSIEAFVAKIEKAAKAHDYDAMVPLLDEEFMEMQLNEIHEGDKITFANEFFCGDFEDKYKCIGFQDIKQVKTKSIKQTQLGGYKVIFEVTNNKGQTIQTKNVWIKTILFNGSPIYRMYGPAG